MVAKKIKAGTTVTWLNCGQAWKTWIRNDRLLQSYQFHSFVLACFFIINIIMVTSVSDSLCSEVLDCRWFHLKFHRRGFGLFCNSTASCWWGNSLICPIVVSLHCSKLIKLASIIPHYHKTTYHIKYGLIIKFHNWNISAGVSKSFE